MHPVLLRLRLAAGQFEVHTFGLLVAAGCLASVLYTLREARRRGLDEDPVRDLWFWTLVASLVGARVAYVATAGRALWGDCIDALSSPAVHGAISACTRPLRVWEGGLVFYGGVIAGAATALFYARRRGLDARVIADVLAPSLALGHAIGRLGCLAAGCCFGKPIDGSLANVFGLRFSDGSIALADYVSRGLLPASAEHTPPLHATQLYEAVGELLLFFVLVRLAPRLKRPGDLALAWLAGYSGLRFAVEVFRGDTVRAFVAQLQTPAFNRALGLPEAAPSFLSTGQASALVVLAAVGAFTLWRRRADAKRAAAA